MLAAQPRLPWGYQEVEYLEKALTANNTADVYIDTGILTSNNIDYDFQGQALGSNETVTFFGGREAFQKNSNEVVYTLHHRTLPTGAQFRYGNKAGATGVFAESPAINVNDVKHYKKDGTTFICNDSSTTAVNQTFSYNRTITLFDVNQKAGLVGNAGGSRIYYFKLFDNGDLVRDYIPCYRKSDSKPGMYDLVSRTFFTNAGTGEFIVGPDVN